jgi:hypothetical protein
VSTACLFSNDRWEGYTSQKHRKHASIIEVIDGKAVAYITTEDALEADAVDGDVDMESIDTIDGVAPLQVHVDVPSDTSTDERNNKSDSNHGHKQAK